MAAKRAKAGVRKASKKGASKSAPKVAARAPAKAKKGGRSNALASKAKAVKAKQKPQKPAKKAAAKRKVAKATALKTARAKTPPSNGGLAVGDPVPALELLDQDGNTFSLGSLQGESYVLYFYPKDDTPGCTREACGFRDELGSFEGKNVRVLGVSPDKPESHTRFREKYGLNFTLLSDVDKAAANAFGVWVKKQNYGREYMGIERSTFLVDAEGKLKQVWRNVRVDGHVGTVLAAAS